MLTPLMLPPTIGSVRCTRHHATLDTYVEPGFEVLVSRELLKVCRVTRMARELGNWTSDWEGASLAAHATRIEGFEAELCGAMDDVMLGNGQRSLVAALRVQFSRLQFATDVLAERCAMTHRTLRNVRRVAS